MEKEESRKERKRVNIVGIKQAVLQRKKEGERVRDNIRVFSRGAFLAFIGYLL